METKKIRLLGNIRKKKVIQPAITNISLENIFWFEVKEYLMSFGVNELPKNIHYTIAFNPSSEYINLHITKNTNIKTDKPRITIAAIKKTDLEELMPIIARRIFNVVFERVNIDSLISTQSVFFMANEKFLRSKSSDLFQDRLIKHFKPLSKVKGRRLKIKGDIDKHANTFIEQIDFLKMMRIRNSISANADRAFVLSENQSTCIAQKIYGHWYKFRDIKPEDFLTQILGDKLSAMLITHLKKSLVILRNAQTKSDTAMHSKYILITKKNNESKLYQ